ncbi:hypothetical protein ACIO3O_05640 [Streptomyces sp. NPDC087440]|uniref:hypothetical protein n=1 Tax=Streptomyces sp. NPDC087440 TaxID=3365790 RepID=UPI0037F61872
MTYTRGGDPSRLTGRPPVDPAVSEASRLLCAGTYLDGAYRDAVLDELYIHEERIPAPSYGFDATRVLAHALRARRFELAWAWGMLALWVLAFPLTGGLVLLLLIPFLTLAVARWIRGRAPNPPWPRRLLAFLVRLYGRLVLALSLFGLVLTAASGAQWSADLVRWVVNALLPDVIATVPPTGSVGGGAGRAWGVLAVFALIAAAVGLQRGQFARVMAGELSPRRFADRAADPAEQSTGVRFARLRRRIAVEQHSPLIMYRSGDPFCGAGYSFQPWALAVELKPRKDRKEPPETVSNTEVLRRVWPLVAELRVPSGEPVRAAAVRDRLRELVLDECVFLPVTGLPRRELAPYGHPDYERHRAGSVEEGGETRRHFLRIRVGGWNEEVVTTVFVRVHTQGGMLMLEVAPHVLLPVRRLFQEADRIAHQYRHNSWFGKAVWACAHTPASPGVALVSLWRGAVGVWKLLTGGHGGAMPDGPSYSVRELASDGDASLFQEMDFDRYLKSIQDRVAGGVKAALRDAGWQTEEFAQQVVNVVNKSLHIGSVHNSAFAVGDDNRISNQGDKGGGGHGTSAGTG